MKNGITVHEVSSGVLKGRREFLKMSGIALAGTGLVLAGCSADDDSMDANTGKHYPGPKKGSFDLGSGDLGVLSYAYSLEQLEADFYTKVVNASGFTANFSSEEQQVLTDLYRHEVIHREFFRTALTGALPNPNHQLVPDLQFNYGSLNFSNRDQVLATAKALEDTGVAAYNGAGKLITDPGYLLLAGKIVSVEARHASAIRSLINPDSKDFAGDDVINTMTGLDLAKNPSEILAVASGFIVNPISANYLP